MWAASIACLFLIVSLVADFKPVTILMIFCFAKCIFDAVRARNNPVYQTDTTESERSFEPYIPRRARRERRSRRRWSTDSVQSEGLGRAVRPPTSQMPPRAPYQERSFVHPGSRQTLSPAGATIGASGNVECQICFDLKSPDQFPSRKMTKKCNHEPTDCCNDCLAQAISTAFEGNMWDDIRCPMCNEQLEFQDMAELAPPNIFQRYVFAAIVILKCLCLTPLIDTTRFTCVELLSVTCQISAGASAAIVLTAKSTLKTLVRSSNVVLVG
jgi:hypothetical protein